MYKKWSPNENITFLKGIATHDAEHVSHYDDTSLNNLIILAFMLKQLCLIDSP